MIGRTLAHYEITAQLGKGGMGEVYRARDTKLGRDVAIKILPAEFSEDPERVARFEREARTLASLQHANIAAIYGFEQDQGHRFLVMELVEGQELSERIAAGALPPAEALKIAAEIAEGLEAAHEAGIVHRDLKPANVMQARDGSVKILDFGLARAYAPEDLTDEERANSPTITAAMTQAGTILGTAAYMSPEQARGTELDRRADIWALGVILFEMLTGKRLFDGATVSDTLAAVLRAEPEWDSLPEKTPRALRRLLRRCLQRDPRERLRDAGDARLELREILTNPEDAGRDATAAPARRGVGAFVAWPLVVLLAAGLFWRMSQSPPAGGALIEFEINPPVAQALREFSVAPDGSALVAVSTRRNGYRSLWLREFDGVELRELPGTEAATYPFWSPDSRSIAFFSEGKLRRLELDNENVQTVADAPNGRGGAWSEDDLILFTPAGEEVLYRVSATGGTPEPVTSFSGDEKTHRFPHFAEGSTNFTYSAHNDRASTVRRYYRSMDGKLEAPLPPGMSECYPASGRLLYVREGNLVAQRFDSSSGTLSGEAQFLASGITDVFPRTGRSAFSVSFNGVLAYLTGPAVDSNFSWYDGNGLLLERSRTPDLYANAMASRDLKHVVFARFTVGTLATDIWINDVARGSSRRLVAGATYTGNLGWGHDDRSVIFPKDGKLYRQELDAQEPELLFDPALAGEAESLSEFASPTQASDGSFLVFSAWDSETDFDIWRLDQGATEPVRLIQSPNYQARLELSPDDQWLAYVSQESGRSDVYVCETKAPASGRLVSGDGGYNPKWNEDGSKLYYIAADETLMEVDVLREGPRIEFGLPRARFHAPGGPGTLQIDDSFPRPELMRVHDGKFLFHTPAEDIPPRVITVVLNWEQRLLR